MAAHPHIQFMALAESGALEAQAVLLCESLRAFGGKYADAPITVVSPRKSRRPSTATLRELDRLDVEFIAADLPSPCPEYGTSFRVRAAAFVARHGTAPFLAQLDSDTLFLRAPEFSFDNADVLARPVDAKGICTSGSGDAQDAYWRELCDLCGVAYEALPWVTTSVDRQRVRANYNGGLILARRSCGIFEKTEEIFLRLVGAGRRSHLTPAQPMRIGSGTVSPEGITYWGTGQVALALACTAVGARTEVLPDTYNVPLHSFDDIHSPAAHPVHVHYHWLCEPAALAANPLLDGRLSLPPAQLRWLRERLPLGVRRESSTRSWFARMRQRSTALMRSMRGNEG